MSRAIAFRRFTIDALALVLLTSVVAGPFELFWLDLPAERVLQLRLFSMAVNFATGGWYGKGRDACVRFFEREGAPSWKRRAAGDIAAFIMIQAPVYALCVLPFGGPFLASLGMAVLASPVAGPVSGFVLDAARGGVPIAERLRRLRPVPKRDTDDKSA